MEKTFNDYVEESRDELEIVDSDTLNKMIEEKEDMVILDVNDKEDVEQRGMVEGAVNISLGTLYYKADANVPDDFKDQPKIINGASDIIARIFDKKGEHTRAAVSVNSLPLGVAVEVDAIFELN